MTQRGGLRMTPDKREHNQPEHLRVNSERWHDKQPYTANENSIALTNKDVWERLRMMVGQIISQNQLGDDQ